MCGICPLTTGTNRFTGDSGDDTFDAGQSTGNLNTLNSGDVLAGGSGNDELTAVINASITPSSITDIETISLTAIAAVTADMSNVTGATTISNQGSTFALTLSGLGVATTANLQDTSTAGQVFTYSSVTGDADAVTIGLKNVTTTASASVLGIETLTLNSAGSGTNTLATLTTDTATKLVVTGTRGLVITNNTVAPLAYVDASANTALDNIGVDIDMAVGAVTVIGGAGNDSFEFNVAGSTSAVGGAGNDLFDYTGTTNTFTIADTLAGGDGAADAMIVDHDDAVAITVAMTSTTGGTVTGVERIRLNGFTDDATARAVTLANISSELTSVQIDAITGATDNTLTVNYGAGAATLRLNIAAAITAGDTLVLDASGTGTTDSLAISNVLTTGDSGSATSNITVTDFETVSIATGLYTGTATAQNMGILSAGSTTAVTVTGSNNLVLAAGLVAKSIDASGLSGSGILSMGAASTITAITGGGNNDVLVGDASSSIDGGAGDDTVTGGTGNDTLIGGAGADTITTGGGAADSISAGDGNDVVVATLTAGNTMTGGDGTDVLSVGVAVTAATASGVSGFETFRSTVTALTHPMTNFTDNSTFTTLQNAVAAGTTAFTSVSNTVTTLESTIAASSATMARLVDGTANSLNVVLLGNATTTLMTASDEETINLSTSSASGATTLTTLTGTDLTTLNITGSNQIIIGTLSANSTSAGSTLTINGSTNTGGISVDASNSILNANITGSATASNVLLTGTAGADTITGGAAADTITGGVSSDSLTGGLGADTFIFANTATGTPSATVFDTITDYVSGTDIISRGGQFILAAQGVAAAGTAAISATGLASFNIADNTLALRLTAVAAAFEVASATTALEAAVFNFGSDAYLFITDATAGLSATDTLVKLTGIQVSTGMILTGQTITTIA